MAHKVALIVNPSSVTNYRDQTLRTSMEKSGEIFEPGEVTDQETMLKGIVSDAKQANNTVSFVVVTPERGFIELSDALHKVMKGNQGETLKSCSVLIQDGLTADASPVAKPIIIKPNEVDRLAVPPEISRLRNLRGVVDLEKYFEYDHAVRELASAHAVNHARMPDTNFSTRKQFLDWLGQAVQLNQAA